MAPTAGPSPRIRRHCDATDRQDAEIARLKAEKARLKAENWPSPVPPGPGRRAAVAALGHHVAMGMPSGTVTFLMTDMEGSTRAWEQHGSVIGDVLLRQAEIIAEAVAAFDGVRPEEQGEGDSVFAVFARASDAVAAAVAAQRQLASEAWPVGIDVRVRMSLHSGDALMRGERNYGGLSVHRTARVRSLAHGGQVLVTSSTASLVGGDTPSGVSLRDLGEHRLKDLSRPERLFQLAGDGLADDFPPLRGLDAVKHNLPIALASFVGREQELADVGALLEANRLVTLTGSGGAGKTRLAMHAAADASERFAAVWWIDLATVAPGESIEDRVMSVLSLRERPPRSALEVLLDCMREMPTMLVLDNCEHLVDAVASFVDALLSRSGTTAMLATSREPLAVLGEAVYRVPPMQLPDDVAIGVHNAERYDSVRLFADRARLVRPAFTLDESNVRAVVEVCRRLDALPLAIELAAARTRMMSPSAITDGLNDRFRLLGGGSRTVPRHQTLRASVDWSHALLSSNEQIVFRRLAVFVGSFPVSAVTTVASAGLTEYGVLDSLDRLVDKSLVQAEIDDDEPRYRSLDTIREYAAERLVEAGERDDVRDRHLLWCAELCAAAAVGLDGPELAEWVGKLSKERANVTAGLDRAAEARDAERLWAMCGALTFWWLSAGHFADAARWFDVCTSFTHDVAVDAQLPARWGATYLAFYAGDFDRGLVLGTETLELARAVGNDRYTARVLGALGAVTMIVDTASAEAQLAEAVELARRENDQWGLADALQTLAMVRLGHGDLAASMALYMEAQPIALRLDNAQLLAWDCAGRGLCNQRMGNLREAVALLDAGMRQAERTGDPNMAATLLAWRASTETLLGHATLWVDPLTRALEHCMSVGAGQGSLVVAAESVRVRLAAGDVAGAEEMIGFWLPTIDSVAAAIGAGNGPFLVATALARDDRAEARSRVDVVRRCAQLTGIAIDSAQVTLAEAVIDLLDGDTDAANNKARDMPPVFGAEPFPVELVDLFSLFGGIAAARGAYLEAARAWGVADGIAARHEIVWTPLRPWTEATRPQAREACGVGMFDKNLAEGAALRLDEALEWASRRG